MPSMSTGHPIHRPHIHKSRLSPCILALSTAALLICGPLGCREASSNSTAAQPQTDSNAAASTNNSAPQTGVSWTETRVHAELARTNPQYNGQAQFLLEGGRVTKLALSGSGITSLESVALLKPLALDARQCRVQDLSPLQGLPILQLYLEETDVEDLTPLQGMPLQTLYLSHTPVANLQPLSGAPLVELNLLGTQVSDLSPLRGMPLQMLWLNETPVTSIAPLAGCPLISLTLHRTLVRDLAPLAGSQLQRLHIGHTPVTDLTPLRGLRLTRLVFQPNQIQTGLDVIRQMTSLSELGTTLEEVMPPHLFWATVDVAGASAQ